MSSFKADSGFTPDATISATLTCVLMLGSGVLLTCVQSTYGLQTFQRLESKLPSSGLPGPTSQRMKHVSNNYVPPTMALEYPIDWILGLTLSTVAVTGTPCVVGLLSNESLGRKPQTKHVAGASNHERRVPNLFKSWREHNICTALPRFQGCAILTCYNYVVPGR